MSGEVEKTVHLGIHASRWLLAPMYLGLALMLIVLLIQFIRDFFRALPELFQLGAMEALPAILSLAIVLLAAHAVLLILQTGYQVYVPGLTADAEPNDGHGRLDYAKLRNNLLGVSTALALLMIFRELIGRASATSAQTPQDLWPLASLFGLLLTAALVLAVADWFIALSRR
ncbi:YqhA family protein [Sulfitobacter sp. JB4-11]|uniref:YqhA family protein n=1 Tax=Sulfitobacter rhodophyticola TaxID=3238304 RepID=UPI0035155CDF